VIAPPAKAILLWLNEESGASEKRHAKDSVHGVILDSSNLVSKIHPAGNDAVPSEATDFNTLQEYGRGSDDLIGDIARVRLYLILVPEKLGRHGLVHDAPP
jgi:hypothetical protein